ncbi:hypothetical protein AB4Z22_46595, partial [Paenibacillus sp. TAF58]
IFDLVPAIEALPASPPRDAILVELRTLTGNVSGALALGLALQAAPAATGDERVVRAHVACALPMVQMATRDFGSVLGQIEIARSLLLVACALPMVQMATRDFGSVLGQIEIARSLLL